MFLVNSKRPSVFCLAYLILFQKSFLFFNQDFIFVQNILIITKDPQNTTISLFVKMELFKSYKEETERKKGRETEREVRVLYNDLEQLESENDFCFMDMMYGIISQSKKTSFTIPKHCITSYNFAGETLQKYSFLFI